MGTTSACARIRPLIGFVLAAAVAACTPALGTRLDARPHGAPVAVPARPTDAACDALIRADTDTALRVRTMIGFDGISATAEAVAIAAADPAADIDLYGVPMTEREVAALREAGIEEPTVALAALVTAHPDSFGTLWIDGATVVISVGSPDEALLRAARCLERGHLAGGVRYVTAGVPIAELNALTDRISEDRNALAREGIEVTIVGSDPVTETVEVGVRVLTLEIADRLVARYGTVVRVVQSFGARPV